MRTLAWTLLCSSVTDKEPQEGLGQGKDVSVTRVILTSVQKTSCFRGGEDLERMEMLNCWEKALGRQRMHGSCFKYSLSRKDLLHVHIRLLLKRRAISVPDRTYTKVTFPLTTDIADVSTERFLR